MTKDQDTYAIVGTFTAEPPFEWLNDGLLFTPRTQQVGKEAITCVAGAVLVSRLMPVTSNLSRPHPN